jgi:sugar diacid utilization regulator
MLNLLAGTLSLDEIKSFIEWRGNKETVYTCVILIFSKDTASVYRLLNETIRKNRMRNRAKAVSYMVDNAAKNEAMVMVEVTVPARIDERKAEFEQQRLLEWQHALFEELENRIQETDGYITAGRIYPSLMDIALSYMEAKEAYIIGNSLWDDRRCFLYAMISAYSVLRRADLSQVDLGYMELLDSPQSGLSFDGIKTLEAYIEQGGYGYKKTASVLYIHENTLRYRIQKIEEFLNLDLDDPFIAHCLITQAKLWRMKKANATP